MANDTRNVKIGVCRVIYDGYDLGLTKGGVEVDVATETYQVNVDQFGKSTINEIIMGRTIQVKVPLAETTLDILVATMPGASLTQTGGAKASGTITLASAPSAGDVVTVNGVAFTFKAAVATNTDVLIGATAAASASNLQAALAAYTDPKVTIAQYTVNAAVVTVTYDEFGAVGNAFTLAKTGTNTTVSGPTLTGGTDRVKAKVSVPTGVGMDLLSIAKKLTLHPTTKPDTDKSEDLIIPKAATSGALQFAYKLDQERIYNVTFNGYPDPTTSVLFTIGDESQP